jgi:hypothetical protein
MWFYKVQIIITFFRDAAIIMATCREISLVVKDIKTSKFSDSIHIGSLISACWNTKISYLLRYFTSNEFFHSHRLTATSEDSYLVFLIKTFGEPLFYDYFGTNLLWAVMKLSVPYRKILRHVKNPCDVMEIIRKQISQPFLAMFNLICY